MTRPLKTHCPHGHAYTPENTGIGVTVKYGKKGQVWAHQARYCKACVRTRKRLSYEADPRRRKLTRAYQHWWHNGDPQGRTWDEVKRELVI